MQLTYERQVNELHEHNGESSYRRFLEGEKEAFDDIINLYKQGLIGFIIRNVGNADIAEDISEDCFVELIVNPGRYKFKSSLKTYLYAIAHNKVKEHFRRNKSASVSLEDIEDYLPVGNATNAIIAAENKEMLNRALSKLPKDYRDVLHLHYFEDMPYDVIEKIMRKNSKQVYNLAFRAKKLLKEILEQEGFIYEEP